MTEIESANLISEIKLICESPNSRVKDALNKAMSVYLTRLKTKMIKEGLEASFQMHLAGLLRDELGLLTISSDERFIVELEKNMGDEKKKNYVDISIEFYQEGKMCKQYLIELKFKKENQSAENQAVINSFIDIYELEQLVKEKEKIEFCYFIFLTDYELYTKETDKGTRKKFPMHDGAKIEAGIYADSSNTAKKSLEKYNNRLEFRNDYKIEYKKIQVSDKNYWFFLLEIEKQGKFND